MNHWHSLSLTALMFVAAATVNPTVCVAADESGAQMGIDELKTRLALTPEQQAQIAPLADERRSRLEGIRGKMSSAASRQEKRAVLQEAKSIQDDFAAKVEPLLSSEQKTEWKKMREEARSKMLERWRSNR